MPNPTLKRVEELFHEVSLPRFLLPLRGAGEALGELREPMQEPLLRAAAYYYLRAKNRRGLPQDAVARFHLGNGARLERLNWLGDGSDNGISQSYGLMVNYLYDLDDIEKNHEAYAGGQRVVASSAVRRLLRGASAELVPVAG